MGSTYANEGAGFVTDYSNLAGAGSAFDSFAKAFQNAQDQKVKNQEVQARIAAMQTQQQRDATDQAIKLKASGLQQEPTGELTDAPATARSKGQTIMEGAKSGFTPQFDENNEVTGTKADPNSMAYMKAMAQANASGLRGKAAMEGNDIKRDAQSAQAVDKIHKNKELQGMRQQATMIDKGLELTSDPNNPPSVTAMHEFAQDVSAALSGKAASSDMKLRSISTPTIKEKLANLDAYITSDPNQPAPPEVVKFWNGMGNRLKDAYDRQMAARANELAKQGSTVYKHNPAAQKAQADAADMYKTGEWRNSPDISDDQSPVQAPPQQQAPPPPTQGLVPRGGFLGKLKGLVGGQPPPQEAAAPQSAPAQDPKIAQFAKENGVTYEHALQVIQERKAKANGGQ